jgi:uncharacterized membrane protein HdeD (DUF308 family)
MTLAWVALVVYIGVVVLCAGVIVVYETQRRGGER